MKKILVSVFAMALAAPAFAQLEEGQITVGGSIGVNAVNSFAKEDSKILSTQEKTREFSIAPEVGYMLTDSWQIGLGLSYAMTQDYENDWKTNTIGVGVFGRKFMPISDKLSFAVVGQAGIAFGSADVMESIPNVNQKRKMFGFGVQVAPEFWFHLTPKTSLTAQLGNINFFSGTTKADDSNNKVELHTTSFGLDWNAVSFGVNFAF